MKKENSCKMPFTSPYSSLRAIWLGLLLLCFNCSLSRADNWEKTCPSSCECKYYNNKRVADCSNAGFTTIPSNLSSSIHVLDLTNNRIEGLENYAFKSVNLINLHKLSLSGNKINYIHPDAFNSLRLLFDLDLSNNQIEKLHPRTFSGMEKMRNLILDGNILSRLEAHQFPPLGNLQHLHINNCRLSYVNSLAFSNLNKINSVSLRGNLLRVLEPELFSSRQQLKSVALGDNPWVCDCKLRRLIDWIQERKIGEAEVACESPPRMAGKKWLAVKDIELACVPEIIVPQTEVPISLGGNATLSCGARGEPLPQIRWVLDRRTLSNHTELTIPFSGSEPNVKFILYEELEDGLLWTNLTVIQLGDDFMLHGYDQSSPFTCMVENPAKIVEKNVTLVIGMVVESPIITSRQIDIYVIIAIVSVSLLILVLLILICYCCLKRQSHHEAPAVKANGNDKAFMERNNILIVNPVEKPPRKNELYEKLPQADIELTDLTKGAHKNFEEMNYPEERVGRVRSPLTPLEEEEFDQSSQKLLNESLNTTATVDYSLQYPDLLDNVKFPRAVSPTQLSYHSLVNPLYSPNPEWRYSYVYPSEFTPNRYSQTMHPQLYHRPGYVTLPRRPRTSSVTSAPPASIHHQLSPGAKLDPIYDTLGPRTTADGTSRTDLTRPMSRSMIDPYNPPTPGSPTSPLSLPLHYAPVTKDDAYNPSMPSHSSTLPRSTPNLLDDRGLSVHNIPDEYDSRNTPTPPASQSNNNSSNSLLKEKMSKVPSSSVRKNGHTPSGPPSVPLRIKSNIKNNNSSNNNSSHIANNNKAGGSDVGSLKPSVNGSLLNNSIDSDSSGSTNPLIKKVPPKPPPKPNVKRLSVSSVASDGTSKIPTSSSSSSSAGCGVVVGSASSYQDEGPDGTEV